MPFLDGPRLRDLMHLQLRARGVADESARHVSRSLIETSLRGVDSHGVHLFPYYVRATEGGRINPRPSFRTLRRKPAVATIDADNGFGHHAGSAAMELAMEMAESCGVGAVGVRRSTHFGAAAYFAQQASRLGYGALAFTNADALVKAFGGRESFFGTNPICFSAPMANEEPFCLDMATSRVSWNKILNHRRSGNSLPIDWACDQNGISTTDAARAAMLEPLGDYKGFGLGMMVEILCALLVDGPFGKDIMPMYGTPLDQRREISHFFVAIRIADFIDVDRFQHRLASLAERIRALAPAGPSPVMVPGDPEKQTLVVRSATGIPVDDAKYDEFLSITSEFAQAVRL